MISLIRDTSKYSNIYLHFRWLIIILLLATWCGNSFNGGNQGIELCPRCGIGSTSTWYIYRSQCFDLKSIVMELEYIECFQRNIIETGARNIDKCMDTYRCTYWVLICAETSYVGSINANPDYGEGSQNRANCSKNNLWKQFDAL